MQIIATITIWTLASFVVWVLQHEFKMKEYEKDKYKNDEYGA